MTGKWVLLGKSNEEQLNKSFTAASIWIMTKTNINRTAVKSLQYKCKKCIFHILFAKISSILGNLKYKCQFQQLTLKFKFR